MPIENLAPANEEAPTGATASVTPIAQVASPVSITPPAMATPPQAEAHNSTDSSQHAPLAARLRARQGELEQAMNALPVGDHSRNDVEAALASATELLTGDPDHPAATTAAAMSRWLESSKHLAEAGVKPAAASPS